jgi:hypothetical protein
VTIRRECIGELGRCVDMRTLAWLAVLVACGSAAPAQVANHHGGPAAPGTPPLPCAARSVGELDPFGVTSIGDCEVVEVGAYVELRDGGRAIVRGGEAKPWVALDDRIPGPLGLRVGMTGGDAARLAPDHRDVRCTVHDATLHCELRPTGRQPDCGADDDAIHLRFAAAAGDGDGLAGAAAWTAIRPRAITEVVLRMPC